MPGGIDRLVEFDVDFFPGTREMGAARQGFEGAFDGNRDDRNIHFGGQDREGFFKLAQFTGAGA